LPETIGATEVLSTKRKLSRLRTLQTDIQF